MNPATPAIVHALPYVAWILLATLAFGSFVTLLVTRLLSDATSGYLRFTAASAAVLAFLALLVDGGLTTSAGLVVEQPGPELVTLRWLGLVLFIVAAGGYSILLHRPRAGVALGSAAAIAGLATLASAAFGWAPTAADGVPLLVQLVALTIATGGSLAAIVLGHWYLVTPKISERPLVLQARLLLYTFVLQGLLFVTWTTLGGGPGQGAWDAFTTNTLLVVLRGLVSIAFPIALAAMAWRTAQTRSMESATGLLYITLAAVMAGTIGAAALYVSTGLLV